MNSYTKLKDGSFGLRIVGKAIAGQTVQIQTKAGAIKSETIKNVLWTGQDKFSSLGTISLCIILVKCKQCGASPNARGWPRIYRNGICSDCYRDEAEEREMGY
jgi:hypothetical protein